MKIGEFRSDDAYERMLQEKEDANMRYVAQIIHEEYYEPTEEELAQVEVPEELHNKLLALARELDRKRESELRARRMKRLSRACAVFLICFVTIGTLTITSADAVKVKLKGLLPWFEEDHVVLNPYDYTELEDWHDYYIFSELPEGYVMVGAEESAFVKNVVFMKETAKITLENHNTDSRMYVDIETYDFEEVSVNGEKAFYFEALSEKLIILMKECCTIVVTVTDEAMVKEDVINLVTCIKFIE